MERSTRVLEMLATNGTKFLKLIPVDMAEKQTYVETHIKTQRKSNRFLESYTGGPGRKHRETPSEPPPQSEHDKT